MVIPCLQLSHITFCLCSPHFLLVRQPQGGCLRQLHKKGLAKQRRKVPPFHAGNQLCGQRTPRSRGGVSLLTEDTSDFFFGSGISSNISWCFMYVESFRASVFPFLDQHGITKDIPFASILAVLHSRCVAVALCFRDCVGDDALPPPAAQRYSKALPLSSALFGGD